MSRPHASTERPKIRWTLLFVLASNMVRLVIDKTASTKTGVGEHVRSVQKLGRRVGLPLLACAQRREKSAESIAVCEER